MRIFSPIVLFMMLVVPQSWLLGQFWQEKSYTRWTEKEARRFLEDSPWSYDYKWVTSNDIGESVRYGTDSEREAILGDFAVAQEWSLANQRPLHLGEFGAYWKADMPSRARWTSFVARQSEERGWSWAYWEFCAGFGAYDLGGDTWIASLRDALVPQ